MHAATRTHPCLAPQNGHLEGRKCYIRHTERPSAHRPRSLMRTAPHDHLRGRAGSCPDNLFFDSTRLATISRGDDGRLGAALASARRLVAQAARCLVSTETCTFRKSFLFTLAGFASRLACSDIGLRRCRWEAFRAPFAGAAPGRTLLAARPWAPLCPSAQPYGRASCSPKNSRSYGKWGAAPTSPLAL